MDCFEGCLDASAGFIVVIAAVPNGLQEHLGIVNILQENSQPRPEIVGLVLHGSKLSKSGFCRGRLVYTRIDLHQEVSGSEFGKKSTKETHNLVLCVQK